MIGLRARQLRALFTATVLLVPALAAACPVCGQAKNPEVENTYILMTVFMSLTPLAMIIGLAAFVVIRLRRAEAEQLRPPASIPAEAALPTGRATP